jgi:hypothetical protein
MVKGRDDVVLVADHPGLVDTGVADQVYRRLVAGRLCYLFG